MLSSFEPFLFSSDSDVPSWTLHSLCFENEKKKSKNNFTRGFYGKYAMPAFNTDSPLDKLLTDAGLLFHAASYDKLGPL